MSNFSSNTPIENIGALELDAVTVSLADGALEASVGPASPTGGAWTQFCCRRIDDGALEAAAVATSGPTIAPCTVMACPRRIDDGALEASATMGPGQTIITYCGCGRVDDGTLEAVAGPPTGANNCRTAWPCVRIDDGAFEAAAAIAAAPSYNMGCTSTQGQMCRRIDDSELETAAAMTASPSFDSVCGSTIGPRCFRRIDDGVN